MQILRIFILVIVLSFCFAPYAQAGKEIKSETVVEEAPMKRVSVQLSLKTCQKDSECTAVETSCGSCCEHVGIRKSGLGQYMEQSYGSTCKDYEGPVCECMPAKRTPACDNGLCVLK